MENISFSTNERFTVAPVLQVIDDSGLTCSVSSSNETVNEIPNQLWQSTSSTHSGVPIYRRNAEPKLKVGRIRDTEYHEQKLKRLQQGNGKGRSRPWLPKSAGAKDTYSFIYHHLQPNIYNILERPVFNRHTISTYYHIYTFLLVFACLILTMFISGETYDDEVITVSSSEQVLNILEKIIMVQFTFEYILRLWSAGCRSRYQGLLGRLLFARRPFCIIDLMVVIASWILIFGHLTIEKGLFAASALRALRFLQIIRMVRVDRRGGTWKLLGSVVYAHSKELLTAIYIAFLVLIFVSYIIWQVEYTTDECRMVANRTLLEDGSAPTCHFLTFGDSLWWGFITLTTIGYGDKVPATSTGQTIAAFFAVVGMAFFALPAGILGTGFALKVQEQHRQKHFARRRNPAALLIQAVWRNYAADEESTSTATWSQARSALVSKKDKSKNNIKTLFSFSPQLINDELFPSVRRVSATKHAQLHSPALKTSSELEQNGIAEDDEDEYLTSDNQLTEKQKTALRFIRMMKFCVAKRKFKEALRPYDVKDVIEQYSAGHVDMLARVKLLQNRMENILGVTSSIELDRKNGPSAGYISRNSMNGRMITLEKKVSDIDDKLDTILGALNALNAKNHPSESQHVLAVPPSPVSERRPVFRNRGAPEVDTSEDTQN